MGGHPCLLGGLPTPTSIANRLFPGITKRLPTALDRGVNSRVAQPHESALVLTCDGTESTCEGWEFDREGLKEVDMVTAHWS